MFLIKKKLLIGFGVVTGVAGWLFWLKERNKRLYLLKNFNEVSMIAYILACQSINTEMWYNSEKDELNLRQKTDKE